MSLSTDQPVSYPLIWHLASIIEEEEATKGVSLNPQPAKEPPLTRDDWEELNFSDVCSLLRHMEVTPRKVYDSVMRLQKHLVLVDKQNHKLKTKFTNYKKANELYIIKNKQLQAENKDLENQLANLEKQLEIACLDKRSTPSSLLLPPSSVFDDSDSNSKHSHHHSQKTKLTKLPDPPMLTDSNAAEFDIDI